MDAQVAPLGGRTMLGLYSVVLGVSVCASERVCESLWAPGCVASPDGTGRPSAQTLPRSLARPATGARPES